MDNTSGSSDWFYDLLEWTYDIKLSSGQKSVIEEEIKSGVDNTDKSEYDLFNIFGQIYKEMTSNPNKALARTVFKALFSLPGKMAGKMQVVCTLAAN
jgi:hypothetical protein